jgi:NADPH-dependent 2,4-dienoyl-CoA reductase/sulfur reductase-like enzyme/rhodanese-related sulfurtransferase
MPLKVVIIGAVATGPKAACRLKRLDPEAQITLVDKDDLISYGGCGIPYFVSGDVAEAKELQSTSFHMVRDAEFFRLIKGVDVMTRTEALDIDRENQRVKVRNLDTGQESELVYDRLLLATGSRPRVLPIPGHDLDGVFTVGDLNGAIAIKDRVAKGQVNTAVVIGAGAIGLEMVESLSDLWGVETSLVEVQDQILPGIVSPTMAAMVQAELRENEVENIHVAEKVQRIEGDGHVERVVTDQRTLEADMVIMAVGVQPNSELAQKTGLETTPAGAVRVNNRFQTSDPNIYAGGDLVENMHLITGKPVYFPSGSLANRHGRVIGTNLAGAVDEFDGIVGSFILKAYGLTVGAAGLSLSRARAEGFDAFSTFVVQGDRAHFYPGMELMYMELVVENNSGRVLGVAGAGTQGDAVAARVNAVAAIMKYNPTVRDVGNLEFTYAPPFSSAMDIVNALGNTADNILVGKNRPIDPIEFAELFVQRNGDFVCLDVRSTENAKPFVEKYPDVWLNIPQEELPGRWDEIPRDKDIVLICNAGGRSYEVQVALDHQNLTNTRNLQGGVGGIKKCGFDLD